MATGSVLMCHNFPGDCFMSQPHTVHYFHPFSSNHLLSKPINVVGQDLFQFHQTCQESLSFFDHLRPHPIPYANYETHPSLLPEGVELELHTLPVDARAVADGDTITVYVNALEDPAQISLIPPYVLEAHLRRNEAKAMRNYAQADALQQIINNYGFRVIKFDNEEVLVHKHRIRLRGIDAPESEMPYGKEATEELTKIMEGKCLRILVYEIDSYGRLVGDIYCDNNSFVQELMLKKGYAWYYPHYDKREALKNWENEAKVKQVGLWASSNPEEPWEWRKNQRNMAKESVPHHNRKKNIPPRLQRIAKKNNRNHKS